MTTPENHLGNAGRPPHWQVTVKVVIAAVGYAALMHPMRLTIVFAVIAVLTGILVAYAGDWWDQVGSLPASATFDP
jgi:hypothetical protein